MVCIFSSTSINTKTNYLTSEGTTQNASCREYMVIFIKLHKINLKEAVSEDRVTHEKHTASEMVAVPEGIWHCNKFKLM